MLLPEKNLLNFLSKEWEDQGLTNEETILQSKCSFCKKLIIFFLIFILNFLPFFTSMAWASENKDISLKAEILLGNDFKSEDEFSKLTFRTIKFLPPNHFSSLSEIKIRENNDRRGLANSHKILLNKKNLDPDEFVSVLIHEIGHIVDLGVLKREKKEQQQTEFNGIYETNPSLDFYRFSWDGETKIHEKKPRNFISKYAQSDIYEDFAESYNFYILHGKNFRQKSGKNLVLNEKYNFLQNEVFAKTQYNYSKSDYQYAENIFDTTVLPYDFDKFLQETDEFLEDEIDDKIVRRQRRLFNRRTIPLKISKSFKNNFRRVILRYFA